MPGFAQPNVLFMGVSDEPERFYLGELLPKLRAAGYTRYIEPCSGAFAMAMLARSCGYEPAEMETSDVTLFLSVLGYVTAGRDLRELLVAVDGETLELPDDPLDAATEILLTQLRLRVEAKPRVPYWQELGRDLQDREEDHRENIRRLIAEPLKVLAGVPYEALDLFDHIKRVRNDPHAVINLGPPTYRGGFERFYDTKGRLEWAEPPYHIFDPQEGTSALLTTTAKSKALLLVQQRCEFGHAMAKPVYARNNRRNECVYMLTNRPDEVLSHVGLRVVPLRATAIGSVDAPILPPDYEITPESTLSLRKVTGAQVYPLKDAFIHRIDFKSMATGVNALVVVDGYTAGFMGYDFAPIVGGKITNAYCGNSLIIQYAMGVPHHRYRLGRVAMMAAITQEAVQQLSPATVSRKVQRLVTVALTDKDELKTNRGIMKLVTKVRDRKLMQNRLTYLAPVKEETLNEALARWSAKEAHWLATRASS